MKDGKIIVTQKDCPHCKKWKEDNAEKLKSKEIKEVALEKLADDSPYWEIFQSLGVQVVPTLIEIEGKNVCELDAQMGTKKRCVVMGSYKNVNDFISEKYSVLS